jgi:chloramphenicol 3-O-phosphotransferase
MKMTGNIVLITGTSGAGKTTTCQTFARRAEAPYLLFGMDQLVGTMFPAKYTLFGAKKREGYYGTGFGTVGWAAIEAMHEMIAAAARCGQNMVVDNLLFLNPPILQDCIWRLKDVPVLLVNLKAPYEALEARLLQRKIELPAPMLEAAGPDGVRELANTLRDMIPWYYQAAYENDCYDLELDSTKLAPDEVCAQIEQRLKQGPGTAFQTLRQRYPQSG